MQNVTQETTVYKDHLVESEGSHVLSADVTVNSRWVHSGCILQMLDSVRLVNMEEVDRSSHIVYKN